MICTEDSLMSMLATMLKTDPADINSLLCKILILPDTIYRRLFHYLSYMGLDSTYSYHQFCCISLRHFSNGSLILNDENANLKLKNPQLSTLKLLKQIDYDSKVDINIVEKRCRNNKAERRADSKNNMTFQTLFAQSAISTLNESTVLSNQELCEKIDDYVANNKRAVFWKKLHLLIPEKTHIQLSDYYTKSFSKCMFKEYITYEDKLILRRIMMQMPDEKPAVVVDRFIETTGSNQYFKRNLVMYIVNLKSSSQK
ncbi:Hypothetical_protein [Hexamita inflata]|uniref:Hypothetical_protein n=1 Tax=Hexamita inflata TaxID=28002 RepID=A0AA86QVY3_9EUKA|nr:Hypothetical protein HINF_LOCUS52783 [Hexamita inflata]